MDKQLPTRQDIPLELTWDLTAIFPNEAAYEAALQAIAEQTDQIETNWAGRIASATDPITVLAAVRAYDQHAVLLNHAGNYAYLAFSVDMADAVNGARYMKFESFSAEVESRLSFLLSELMEVDDALLEAAGQLDSRFASVFADIRRRKKHKLSAETEKVLAALSPALRLPETVYEQTKHVDMDFGTFEANGQSYPLSFVLFENDYNLERDPVIRRAAFDAFSKTLAGYQNTVAAVYNGEVQKQKVISRLRGYDSVFDFLLDDQKVNRDLYDRQIDVIMRELAPHMRRYARLLQQAHGLDKMTFADLKISLDPDFDPQVTIEQSKSYIDGALSSLGLNYRDTVMRAYDERWVDFAQNKGKSTGGFCASPYGLHAFILLSWNGLLSEVFTLAHELGHAGHFILAAEKNPYLAFDTSLYFVEAPSTCNELLLTQYLLKQQDEPRFQRWVLSSMIQNTYYHNFVTHLLEAAYQREVYRRVEQGESLSAGDFSAIKRQILQDFWGDAVEINEGAELTWMRQPHYYRGLYPYTYSAGLTIATEVSQRILTEGEPAIQDWLQAMRAGGAVTPVEFAAMAGVDITTEQPLHSTIARIGAMIDQIEDLSQLVICSLPNV